MGYSTEILQAEIIDLEEAKKHMNVTFSDDDFYIASALAAAIGWAESYSEKAIRRQRVTAYYDILTATMLLPIGNALEVEEVSYVGTDGSPESVPLADIVLRRGSPSRISIKNSVPDHKSEFDSVAITYIAGYEGVHSLPERAKHAILMMAADLYENREGQIMGVQRHDNPAMERLLWPLREVGL